MTTAEQRLPGAEAQVGCHETCLVSGGPLRPCFRIGRFPVLSSVTSQPPGEDIFYPLEIGIGVDCGLAQQKYLPPPAVLYAQARNSGGGALWQRHYRAFAEFIRARARLDSPCGIAEVGSGNGRLARLFPEAARVVCFEPAPTFTQGSNIEIIADFFPSRRAEGRQFDCLFASHTFEHSNDPLAFLRAASDHLRDGGSLCLSVPNFGVALSESQINCFNSEHTLYLTPESFPAVLEYAGFAHAVVETFENHSLFIHATKNAVPVPRRGSPPDAAALDAQIQSYLGRLHGAGDTLRRLLDRHRAKTKYLFGGHMMSTVVLFALNIPEAEFRGILDNDPLKDGLRLYGTGLNCRLPERVYPEDAVVFLNGGAYHEEIRQQLAAQGFEVAEWSIR